MNSPFSMALVQSEDKPTKALIFFVDWATGQLVSESATSTPSGNLTASTTANINAADITTPNGDKLSDYSFDVRLQIYDGTEWVEPGWIFNGANGQSFGSYCNITETDVITVRAAGTLIVISPGGVNNGVSGASRITTGAAPARVAIFAVKKV